MASPVDAGQVGTSGTTATTSPVVDLPGSIAAGNLLIIKIRNMAGGTMAWPSGWTEFLENSADATNDTTGMGWRAADGSEGASVTLTNLFSASGKFGALAWRITGAADPTIQPPETAVAVGTNTTPDAPNISPTGGSKDYLFLAAMGWDGESFIVNGDPTGYGNVIVADSGTGGSAATNGGVRGLSRQATAGSENPSSWTLNAAPNAGWTAVVVAVHPAAAATFSPPPFGGRFRPQFHAPRRRYK